MDCQSLSGISTANDHTAASRKRSIGTDSAQTTSSKSPRIETVTDTVSRLSLSGLANTDISPEQTDLPAPVEPYRLESFYAESEQDFNRLINICLQQEPDTPLALVRHPDDFDQEGMTVTSLVKKDDHGQVLEQLHPGILNGNQPATLIIDCRSMSTKAIAACNELLEPPHRFRGDSINPNCRIVVLINSTMVPDDKQGMAGNKCSDDFWRRISRCGNSWDIPEHCRGEAVSDTLPWDKLPELAPDQEEHDNDLVLDFSTTDDWRQLLFGRVVLDHNNQRHYSHGPLVLARRSHHRQVILRGAPWHDPQFQLTITQLLVRNTYQANGETISLEGLGFVRQPADKTQLTRLQRNIQFSPTSTPSYFCLNKDNFEDCLGENALHEDDITAKDVLASVLGQCSGLRITSALSARQWHRLLLRIQKLKTLVTVAVDNPAEQPLEYTEGAVAARLKTDARTSTTSVIRCSDDALISSAIEGHLKAQKQTILELSVTPDIELAQLAGEIEVGSLNRRHIKYQRSGLLKALEKGQPVVLRNLHKNPVLQRQLEGLCQTPPRLLLNGQLQKFKQARIYTVLPEGSSFSSPVWQKLPLCTVERGLDEQALCHEALTGVYQLNPEDQRRLQQLQTYLTRIVGQVPVSSRQHWPWPAQRPTLPVLRKVLQQLTTLKQHNTATVDNNTLWRQAISQMILDEYRGHSEVYAYLQQALLEHFPTQQPEAGVWLDPAPFEQLLASTDIIDKTTLKNYCWRLSQGLSPSCMPKPATDFNHFPAENIEVLARALLACCPENRQDMLRATLHCHSEPLPLPPRSAITTQRPSQHWQQWQQQQLSELTTLVRNHPLVFLKGEPGAGKTWSAIEVANSLGAQTFTVTTSPQSEQGELLRVSVTSHYLSLSERELAALALTPDERRLLTQLATEHSQTRATLPATHQPLYRIPLNPATEQILKSRFSQEAQRQLLWHRDSSTHYEDGPLLRWAKTSSKSGEPVVLIVDEANLAPTALWDIFQGLQSGDRPILSFGGQVIKLQPEHHIIFTGNPESASGRSSSLNLREQAVTRYYPALPEGFLEHQILRPRLQEMKFSAEQQEKLSNAIITLWQRFLVLNPSHEFTPRDIHELCDRLQIYRDMQDSGTDAALFRMVWLAVRETLGGGSLRECEAIDSLELWYRMRFCPELTTGADETFGTRVEQAFASQLLSLKANSKAFCCEGNSVEQLTQVYWSALIKRQRELDTGQVLQGKRATLVEGPAGRGKDALLHQVLIHNDVKYTHLNGSCQGWPVIREKLKSAAEKGEVVIISELNLLPSQYLEGELNDVLTGTASPGFHLFATVNPPEFSGRERLSPALQSRFISCRIGDYSDTELNTIARASVGPQLPDDTVHQIVFWHCQLRKTLRERGKPNLQPGTSTLLELLREVEQQPTATVDDIRRRFASLYHIQLRIAGKTMADLDSIPATPADVEMQPDNSCRELVKYLYTCFPGAGPITIRSGTEYNFQPETGLLRIPEPVLNGDLKNPEVLESVVRCIVAGLWQSKGMPESFSNSDDTLAFHLFTLWQRRFAKEMLKNCPYTEQQAEQHIAQWFPLPDSAAAQVTMRLTENRALIDELLVFLDTNGTTANPVLYRQFLNLLAPWRRPVAEQISSNDAMDTDSPQITDIEKQPLPDQDSPRVNYQQGTICPFNPNPQGDGKTLQMTSVFSQYDYRDERHRIMTPVYSPEEGLRIAHNIMGGSGFNKVQCQPRPEHVLLECGEEPGRIVLDLSCHDWKALPGLIDYPQAKLKYINLTPQQPFEVVQDRASGVFLIRLLPTPSIQHQVTERCTVDFVLELSYGASTAGLGHNTGAVFCDCPKDIDTAISTHNDPAVVELREKLDAATSVSRRMELINDFCSSASMFKSYEPLTTTGRNRLSELLRVRPSSRECRAMVCWMLASKYRIPTRFSIAASGCAVVEFSTDGGYSLDSYNLKGHVKDGTTKIACPQDFSAVPKKPEKQIYDYFSQDDNPQVVADLLRDTSTGSILYQELCAKLGIILPPVISLAGPVSVDLVKNWLKTFSTRADIHLRRNQPEIISSLMAGIFKRMEKNPSEEMTAIYKELSLFVDQQGWLPMGRSSDMIHFLQRYKEAGQKRVALYNQVFTHNLAANNDIRMAGQPLLPEIAAQYQQHNTYENIAWMVAKYDQDAREVTDPELSRLFEDTFQHAHSPKLLQTLRGEVPGVQFQNKPPGTLDLVRFIHQLPAYRRSATVVDLRPAIVVFPWPGHNERLAEKILPLIQDDNKEMTEPYQQESMSEVLSEFIPPYINQTFLHYLFRTGGGETGSLKVLFPSDLEHGNTRVPLTMPYRPVKAGWVAPANPQDFVGLMSVPKSYFVKSKQEFLSREWASQAFNHSELCLIDSNMMGWLINDYLQTTDWQSLIKTVTAHSVWQAHAQKMHQQYRNKHIKEHVRIQTKILMGRNQPVPDDLFEQADRSERFAQAGLFNDLRDEFQH